jgi:nitroreductase
MNEIIKSINVRKSVREYLPKEIPAEIKQQILNAALQAPTAGNMTLYTIIDVTDQQITDKLVYTCDNQPFIAKAPLVLVFCADYYRWHKVFCDYVDDVRPVEEGDLLLANQDALIAAQNAVVAAESFGIGSCYIGDIIERFEQHKEIFNLPPHVVPCCMVCFGYPTEGQTARQKPPRFEINEVVYENTYNLAQADKMGEMLAKRQGIEDKSRFAEWMEKFCARKWNSDFSIEMSRSAREIIKYFCKK